jgi:radical SAM protein with 4Fe4S-binding SPASM domain
MTHPGINEKTLDYFHSLWEFNGIIDVNHASTQPHRWIFQELRSRYKESYEPRQRIVLAYSGSMSIELANSLQQMISHLNIGNFFIVLLTDHQNNRDQFDKNDPIYVELIEFDKNYIPPLPSTDWSLSSTLCISAWARMEITTDGSIRPCCALQGVILDDQNTPTNIQTHSLKEVYHSRFMKDLRSQLRKGERPEPCRKCWQEESVGVKSVRQLSWWELEQDRYSINWDLEEFENVHSFAFALGNICNLKCRICSDEASSQWAIENLADLPSESKKSSKTYIKLKNKSWVEKELPIWKEIKQHRANLSEMRFTGGEPMLINQHFDMVREVSESPEASNIILRYTTNGTQWPEHMIDVWKRFRQVEITLSIDDVGQRFEYQRKNAVWDEVQENVKKFFNLRAQGTFVIKCNTTITNMNVWYLPEIVDWLDSQDFDFVRLNVLYTPPSLSIYHTTAVAREKLLERFESTRWPQRYWLQVEPVIQAVRDAKVRDGRSFCETIRKIDLRRNENFQECFPEMADLMGYTLDKQ